MNRQVKSTCCYCGVGCGVVIETENGTIIDVRGDHDHPANRGRLCTKGATLAQTAELTYRLPVSYTHLDVYKRQVMACLPSCLCFS